MALLGELGVLGMLVGELGDELEKAANMPNKPPPRLLPPVGPLTLTLSVESFDLVPLILLMELMLLAWRLEEVGVVVVDAG